METPKNSSPTTKKASKRPAGKPKQTANSSGEAHRPKGHTPVVKNTVKRYLVPRGYWDAPQYNADKRIFRRNGAASLVPKRQLFITVPAVVYDEFLRWARKERMYLYTAITYAMLKCLDTEGWKS